MRASHRQGRRDENDNEGSVSDESEGSVSDENDEDSIMDLQIV